MWGISERAKKNMGGRELFRHTSLLRQQACKVLLCLEVTMQCKCAILNPLSPDSLLSLHLSGPASSKYHPNAHLSHSGLAVWVWHWLVSIFVLSPRVRRAFRRIWLQLGLNCAYDSLFDGDLSFMSREAQSSSLLRPSLFFF
jgi:hypothetical protein